MGMFQNHLILKIMGFPQKIAEFSVLANHPIQRDTLCAPLLGPECMVRPGATTEASKMSPRFKTAPVRGAFTLGPSWSRKRQEKVNDGRNGHGFSHGASW